MISKYFSFQLNHKYMNIFIYMCVAAVQYAPWVVHSYTHTLTFRQFSAKLTRPAVSIVMNHRLPAIKLWRSIITSPVIRFHLQRCNNSYRDWLEELTFHYILSTTSHTHIHIIVIETRYNFLNNQIQFPVPSCPHTHKQAGNDMWCYNVMKCVWDSVYLCVVLPCTTGASGCVQSEKV